MQKDVSNYTHKGEENIEGRQRKSIAALGLAAESPIET